MCSYPRKALEPKYGHAALMICFLMYTLTPPFINVQANKKDQQDAGSFICYYSNLFHDIKHGA